MPTNLTISGGAVSERPIYYPTNIARKAKLDPITITLESDDEFNNVVLYYEKYLNGNFVSQFSSFSVGGNNQQPIYSNEVFEASFDNSHIFSGGAFGENGIFYLHGTYRFYATAFNMFSGGQSDTVTSNQIYVYVYPEFHYSSPVVKGEKITLKSSDLYNIQNTLFYNKQVGNRSNIITSNYNNDFEYKVGAGIFDSAVRTIHSWHSAGVGRPYSPARVHPQDVISAKLLLDIQSDLNGFFYRVYKRGAFKILKLAINNGQMFDFDIDKDNYEDQFLPAPLPANLASVQIQFQRAWQNTSVVINNTAVAAESNTFTLMLSSGLNEVIFENVLYEGIYNFNANYTLKIERN